MKESFEVLFIHNLDGYLTYYSIFRYTYKSNSGNFHVSSLGSFGKTEVENILQLLQKTIQEPLKYFKDPIWSFIALKTLKDPKMKLIINLNNKIYYIISKESILEATEETYSKLSKIFFSTLS